MSGSTLKPRESAELIMRHAKYVKIDEDGIKKTADIVYDAICSGKISPTRFTETELHPTEANERSIDWIFLIDTLNFSFWAETGKPHWEVAYKGKTYSGYFALCAGVNRAIDEGLDLTNPRVYASLTREDILRIFQSETSVSIPLIDQRIENLKEASRVLLEKYQGSFVNCVKAAGQSAQRLLELIVQDFPSYRDEGVFQGSNVSFWKRCQILVGDIWACFEGKGLGYFHDIDSLAMFPDYRIPQVLVYFGAIKYSPELYALLEKDELLESGSVHEMEIRGASIHAVELIKERVKILLLKAATTLENKADADGLDAKADTDCGTLNSGVGESSGNERKKIPCRDYVNSILIDHFLWDYRREHVEELDKFPFHKVRCIYY